MTSRKKHARVLAGALAAVVGLAFVAPPAFAAGPTPGPIAAAAAAKVEAAPAANLAQAKPASPAAAPETSKPFLKTGKGAVALVLLAGAFGYAFYSFSNGRVKSPAK